MEFETLVDIYKEQIVHMAAAGVDLLVVETMMSLQECRAALLAAKECGDMAVMVSLTFEKDGRTLFGTDPASAAVTLESLGAAAVGINCSTGPGAMAPLLAQMARVSRIPLLAKPNAGLPMVDDQGRTVYDMGVEEFVGQMGRLADMGICLLGGCCGTNPAYIQALAASLEGRPCPVGQRRPEGKRYLCSERQALGFGLEDRFLLVGERINPTGKKALQESLRRGDFSLVQQLAQEQEAKGASLLDVNMGMGGVDEKALLCQALEEVAAVSHLPLSIDSSHVDVQEAALRRYPGRALINSISLEREKFTELLPLAAKYGAMFVLLPLSDAGLPENMEEKKRIIHTIMERALELGMSKEDIVVDGLVTTVGANPLAAREALDTIAYCKSLGLATTCGLSNISFGMPGRPYANMSFLTLAIGAGLTMAIANPSSSLLTAAAHGADMLLAKEGADEAYIRHMQQMQEEEGRYAARMIAPPPEMAVKSSAPVAESHTAFPRQEEAGGIAAELREAVLKGRRQAVGDLTRMALDQGHEAQALLSQILIPAINDVGDLFEQGKYFLPQLIGAAEAMKLSIEVLEPLLAREGREGDMPTIVIATVEGDIHDIGKNLVALMLKNYGFSVHDLGKDVPAARIVEAAKEYGADIIALSALMTTTMRRMAEVVALCQEQGLDCKVMVGGAVVTEDYAQQIGADGYSADAAEAILLAKRLLGLLSKGSGHRVS